MSPQIHVDWPTVPNTVTECRRYCRQHSYDGLNNVIALQGTENDDIKLHRQLSKYISENNFLFDHDFFLVISGLFPIWSYLSLLLSLNQYFFCLFPGWRGGAWRLRASREAMIIQSGDRIQTTYLALNILWIHTINLFGGNIHWKSQYNRTMLFILQAWYD